MFNAIVHFILWGGVGALAAWVAIRIALDVARANTTRGEEMERERFEQRLADIDTLNPEEGIPEGQGDQPAPSPDVTPAKADDRSVTESGTA